MKIGFILLLWTGAIFASDLGKLLSLIEGSRCPAAVVDLGLMAFCMRAEHERDLGLLGKNLLILGMLNGMTKGFAPARDRVG